MLPLPLMPEFHKKKKAAGAVGRIVTGYGELTFLLAWCAGTVLACQTAPNPGSTLPQHRIAGEHEGIRRIFAIRGQTNRIDAAKRLIRPVAVKVGIENDYIEIMGSFSSCLWYATPLLTAIGIKLKNADYSLLILKKLLGRDLFSR